MLQDLRHIVILDFRPSEEFQQSHIRLSLNVTLENYHKIMLDVISGTKERQHPYRSHFEGDSVKRLLFILPTVTWKEYEA